MKVKQYRLGNTVWERRLIGGDINYFVYSDEVLYEETLIAMGAVPISQPKLPKKYELLEADENTKLTPTGEMRLKINQIIDYLEKREV